MRRRLVLATLAAVLLAAGLGACGGDGDSGAPGAEVETPTTRLTTTTAPSRPATTTTTTATTTTTTSTTTTTTTTTPPVDPALPTYSEVVSTHWPGAELCGTKAGISGGPEILQFGPFGDEAAVTSIQPGFPMGFCPGAKYIVSGELTLAGGDEFPIGTLLTLDADLDFVAVSSWD